MSGSGETATRRGEDGFALISAIAILLIVSLVTAVGALAVVRSFSETNRARTSTTAFAAADAAIDVVTWRMNKQLVASEIQDLDGLSAEALATLGCADVDAAGVVQLDLAAAECTLEIAVGGDAIASCSNSLDASIPPDLSPFPVVASRNLICSATVRNTTRRLFARVELELQPQGALAAPTSLWRQTKWAECPSNPAAACPPA